jgi:hypothetical protein
LAKQHYQSTSSIDKRNKVFTVLAQTSLFWRGILKINRETLWLTLLVNYAALTDTSGCAKSISFKYRSILTTTRLLFTTAAVELLY